MKSFVVILSVVAVAVSSPVGHDDSALRLVFGNFVNCVNSDELNICLKEHALKAAERLGGVRKLKLTEGITLIHEGERVGKSLEPLSTDPEVKSRQLTDRLWDSASDLLKNSEIELTYSADDDNDDDDVSRALGDVEESRGKKKKLKKKLKALIPLAILAKIKAIALALLALWLIAISVFKLAVIAKVAFIAKIIAIIKALLVAKKLGSHHTEEVWIPPPHHEEHHEHHDHGWEGGWSRSRNEANNLAYSAYRK